MDKEYKTINIKELKAYEKNNKKHGKNVDEIVKSIQANTYITPIIVDENYVILAGHGRKLAMDKLQIKEADVLVVSGLSEAQKRDFRIRDNKLTELSEWDFDNLRIELDELDIPELSDLFKDVEELEEEVEAKEDDYEVPEGGIETDIVLGDLFEIGEHRLLCGDSTDSDQVSKLMNGEKADMVFTDPPYGMFLDTNYDQMFANDKNHKKTGERFDKVKGDHNDFVPELINTIFACFNDTKEIFIWGADYFAELIPDRINGSWVVWDKRCDENMDKVSGNTFELCWSKQKHKRLVARILWSGHHGMHKDDTKTRVHPTQKPTELAKWFFNQWGNKDDLIADLFLGSGSTMVASHQLKRKCYGMELDPKYCQVIIDRMIRLAPEIKIKKNGVEYNHATGDYTLLDK